MIKTTEAPEKTKNTQSMDPHEIARFAQHADAWWEPDGAFKTLHDINPARLDWIQQYIKPNGLNMLDIGCGGGILAEGLARCGAKVTGLDLEAEALRVAREHAKQSNLSIQYVCEPIESFVSDRLDDASGGGLFDAITCLEMLEHVDTPQLVVDSAAALLKPGGFLFLSTVNRTAKAYASVIVAAEYVLSLLPRQTHSFERFIRPSELAAGARKAGLEVLGVTGLDYSPFSRKAVLREGHVDINYLLVAQKSV